MSALRTGLRATNEQEVKMIVTVRRWTIALPRLKRVRKASQWKVSERKDRPAKRQSFIESYANMFEHQVNLMFKDDMHR